MNVRVKELTPELTDDFLSFFDHVAFSDNPRWAKCYCQYYHTDCPNDMWEKRAAGENRQATIDMIAAGRMHGYLAYVDDRPAGWCHADALAALARLKDAGDEPGYAGKRAGAIVCFLVAPGLRRQGIATQLLDRACDDFKVRGYDFVEAYPRKTVRSDAENYHGPLAMYLAAGFQIAGGNDVVHIVRKALSQQT